MMWRKYKLDWKTIFFLILLIECALILHVNFTNRLQIVNEDAANVYVHTAEMWKNHSFYIPQWKYETTAEWDCAVIFALPLYGMVHNIHIAFAISNMIFLFIFIWTAFKLFQDYDRLIPLVGLCFVLIPYSVGMLGYFNMLFFSASQYIIKILVPLMLVALLLHFDYRKKTDVVFLVLLCFFSFLTACSSGIYVWGCGIMAVLCGYILLTYKEKAPLKRHFGVISVLMILCTWGGYLVNRLLEVNTKGNTLILRSVGEELWMSPMVSLSAIAQMFSLSAEVSGVSMLSKEGIRELMVLFLIFVLLFCAGGTIYRTMHGKIEMLPALLSFLFIWNTLIQCLNTSGNAGRYHLMGIIPLFFVAALSCVQGSQQGEKQVTKQWKILVIAVFLIMQSVTSYKRLYDYREMNYLSTDVPAYAQICSFAETQDVDYVYLITRKYWSEICRMIAIEGNIKYLFIDKELGEVQIVDYYAVYDHARFNTERALIVADNERDSDLEYVALFGDALDKVAVIDHYDIYKFK